MPWREHSKSSRQTAREQKCASKYLWRGDMSIRVVLADDHELVRQGLRALLEREGFQVVGEASNGHEAVRLVPGVRPDVAILDISMPILNGLDAARELQKPPQRTRTILLTHH